jgi:hypothetical protein
MKIKVDRSKYLLHSNLHSYIRTIIYIYPVFYPAGGQGAFCPPGGRICPPEIYEICGFLRLILCICPPEERFCPPGNYFRTPGRKNLDKTLHLSLSIFLFSIFFSFDIFPFCLFPSYHIKQYYLFLDLV